MKTKQQTNGLKARVGVLGMGIMGGAMAETLLAHDFPVTGFDIDPKARARLKKAGGKAMTNVADVACQSDVLIISLPSSKALAKVTEALVSMPQSSWTKPPIVIEASTLPLADKEAFANSLRKLGITTLDSPVSGTAVRIRERDWTFFCEWSAKGLPNGLAGPECIHGQRGIRRTIWQWHEDEVCGQPSGGCLQRGLCRVDHVCSKNGTRSGRSAPIVWQQPSPGYGLNASAHAHDGGEELLAGDHESGCLAKRHGCDSTNGHASELSDSTFCNVRSDFQQCHGHGKGLGGYGICR